MPLSQKFRNNVDRLSLASTNDLFMTSFLKDRVLQMISINPTCDRVMVRIVTDDLDRDLFSLQAVAGATPLGDAILGDFPCPTECIPPIGLEYVRFMELNHILIPMAYANCVLLNIHLAFYNNDNSPVPTITFASYAVTIDANGKPVARWGANDNIYISIHD